MPTCCLLYITLVNSLSSASSTSSSTVLWCCSQRLMANNIINRTDATANDSLKSFSVVGRREPVLSEIK